MNVEDRTQAAIVQYVRTVAPLCRIMAIPNGGLRSKSEAARMKWTGTLAGAPDLVVALPEGQCLWIEVKAPAGKLSTCQKDMHADLWAIDHDVIVARSIDDVRDAFARLGLATREAA